MIFSKNKTLKVYYPKNIPESINIAIKNFFIDIGAMFNKPKYVSNESDADIIIKIENLGHNEEYKYIVKEKVVYIYGSDDLGVIYGIYSFLENELNVPPFYKMEGLKLFKKDDLNIDNKTINEYPHTRFRGWFINDEDLICGFKKYHKRNIEFLFHGEIPHPDIIDRVVETALRNKVNLIIPSTFVDIDNKHEEKLLEICAKSGLFLTQHHVEPLGVSKFGFRNFAKKYSLNDDSYSFVTNKENMIKCYEEYIKKWAKYPRVIFQLGLRGGLDEPVWNTEKNVGTSPEARGKLIGDAIKTQYELVKKYYPHKLYTSATLWMEGAELLKEGYLKLPKDTIVVLSDIGMSQLYGDDFFKIKFDYSSKYGIYYHAGYVHTGPHLAEGVIPEKMKYAYDLANDRNANYYSMLNVANVKDVLFTIYVNSKIVFNNNLILDDIYRKYARFYIENNSEKLIEAIKLFYSAQGDIGEEQYKIFCNKYNFSYHKYNDIDFPVVSFNDGMFRAIHFSFYFETREEVKTPIWREVAVNGIPLLEKVCKQFDDLLKDIPNSYIDGYSQHFLYQSQYLSQLMKSGIYFYDGTEALKAKEYEKARQLYSSSQNELKIINLLRKKYFTNEYKKWFNGDRVIGINQIIKHIDEEYCRAANLIKDNKIIF